MVNRQKLQLQQKLQEIESNYVSTLHKENTVQSRRCNEYINIRRQVQIKLYKVGLNLRTTSCVMSCHLFLYATCVYFADLCMFPFVVFTFNWLLVAVKSFTKQTE